MICSHSIAQNAQQGLIFKMLNQVAYWYIFYSAYTLVQNESAVCTHDMGPVLQYSQIAYRVIQKKRKKRKPNILWNNFVNLHARSSSMVVLEAQDPYVTVLKKLGLYLEFFFHS